MKFLFVAGDVNRIGGIEKYNRDFVSALTKTGATVILVERRKGGVTAKFPSSSVLSGNSSGSARMWFFAGI